ncbi:MAG: carboxypeptidase-like regulatory domain-containing protein [Flavobacterium sp.]|nr:carboxypeptidase-like regulatory domain-containing protein [Flavobacterium sp.]
MKYFWAFLFVFLGQFVFSQKIMQGQILDFDTNVPIAFAKISYNNKTISSDWEGKFNLEIKDDKQPILFFYKGYFDKKYYFTVGAKNLLIKMTSDNSLQEKEIYSENIVNTIIKKVGENKSKNQPERAFKTFEYKNYEYLLVTANPDSISPKIDTVYKRNLLGKTKFTLDSVNYKFKKILEKQHVYQTEKVNQIQYNGKVTKETIIAARMAGFKQPLYEYLGLNLVSYSLYDNKLQILEIPIENPISSYGRKLFVFKLIDTVKVNGRSVYRIYFQPKKLKSNRLRGLLYVDAENYGIAKAFYRIYGIINVNATYTFNYLKNEKLWFPEKRKIIVVKGNNSEDINILGGTIKFNSSLEKLKKDASDRVYLKLESTPYDIKINESEIFEHPQIKIDAQNVSNSKPDSYWNNIKKDTVDKRKIRTYTNLDSLSMAGNIEKKLLFGRKVFNGYLPISYVDIDLKTLLKYNNYEGFRLGIGGVTNSKLSNNYKVSFYGAYGLKDQKIKYGITPSFLLDKKTNTWISASYSNDINEIGQIQFATEPRRFKIYDPRPINISTFYNNKLFSGFMESKYFAKTDTYFGISRSEVTPLFDYTYVLNGNEYSHYTITAAQFAIQWNPFSTIMQTTSGRLEINKQFPKFSLQFTQTLPQILGNDFMFSKVDLKIVHEIPYLSGQNTAFTLQGGLASGNIPLTHLYSIAPNNLNRESLFKRITFASKNGFETMFFNEFFSSRYVSFQVRHTFNKVKLAYKIKPLLSVVTRLAFGAIDAPQQHAGFEYKTLDKGFFESGVEANQIFKGFGLIGFVRYGPNSLPNFTDNISVKLSYVFDLGF